MEDLTGVVFGKFTIKGLSHKDNYSRWHYKCICECGNEFSSAKNVLKYRKSCGLNSCRDNHITHGMKYTREYNIYHGIKNRCLNKNSKDYYRYGGKGISLSDEWMKFENFINDMGKCPSNRHQVDRIDNNGIYSKENCRWSLASEQQSNKRKSSYWVIKGVEFNNSSSAAKFYNVSDTTICKLVYGYFDKRRGTSTKPKENCYLKPKYESH